MAPDFLTMAGIPGAGPFRLRIDREKVPKEVDLRSKLLPSVMGASVDARGIRFILREAFPLACAGSGTSLKSKIKWSTTKGFERDLKLGLKGGLGR